MKNLLKIAAFSLCFQSSLSFAAKPTDCKSPSGIWVNKRGASITIDNIKANSQFEGIYKFPGDFETTPYPLIGWFTEHKPEKDQPTISPISFSVRWTAFGSISNWIGTCTTKDGQPRLELISHQVKLHARAFNERITTHSEIFYASKGK